MQRICVYCGSSPGADEAFAAAARRLGLLLAERDVGVVFGGGSVGLMGILADAALSAGGSVTGVIPRHLARKELAHANLTRLHIVETMHERKRLMAELSDGFIALPGGFGTLDEFAEMVTWRQLGHHDKPVALLNVSGYFDHLLAFVAHAVDQRLIRAEHRAMILADDDPTRLLQRMLEATPEAAGTDKWLDRG